jgi:1-phosphofructokinase family hexose kinase
MLLRDVKIKDISDREEVDDSCFDLDIVRGQKIAVLSLNPGIDHSLYLSGEVKTESLNRVFRSITTQGSKGANLAIMLSRIGCDVEYYSFTGGEFGALCDSFISREGIKSYTVESECGVRMNTKIIDALGRVTEVNERGGVFRADETEKLLGMLLSTDATVLCLCGSVPLGIESNIYGVLTEWGRESGRTVVVDCDGESMIHALISHPTMIKPNISELSGIGERTGLFPPLAPDAPQDEIAEAARAVAQTFETDVLCTMGERGAVLVCADGEVLFRDAMKVFVASTTAAGDTFLACFLAGRYEKGFTREYSLLCGAAGAAAKVVLEGSIIPDATDLDDNIYLMLHPECKETGRPMTEEELILEGIEPWNIQKICHSKTKQ